MTLDEMVIRLETVGGDNAAAKVTQVTQAVSHSGAAATDATGAFKGMGGGLMDIGFAAEGMIASVGAIAALLAGLSGIKLAGQMQLVQQSFSALLGDMGKAKRLMQEMRELGERTRFGPEAVMEATKQILAVTPDTGYAMRTMHAITQTIGALGGTTEQMTEAAQLIGTMRVRPEMTLRSILGLKNMGLPIDQIVGAALGRHMRQNEGMRVLQGMGGVRASDIVTKGMEKLYGGYQWTALLDVLAILKNTVGEIALSTGKFLLPVLVAVLVPLRYLAEVLKRVNELGYGLPGVAAIIYVLWRSWALLTASFRASILAVTELTTALFRLAGSAGAATGATTAQAGASAAGAGVQGTAAALSWVGILGFFKGLPGRMWSWTKGAGSAALGFAKGTLGKVGIGFGISALGEYFNNDYLKNAGLGFGIGALLQWIPYIGKAMPYIGALAGVGITWWQKTHPDTDKDKAADKLDTTNSILQDIRGNMIGGGRRGRMAVAQTEIEIMMARAFAGGLG